MYISRLYIKSLRGLDGIEININEEKKKNLVITGINGIGKTSLLEVISVYFQSHLKNYDYSKLEQYKELLQSYKDNLKSAEQRQNKNAIENWKATISNMKQRIERLVNPIKIEFADPSNMKDKIDNNEYITTFFKAQRVSNLQKPNGVEVIDYDSSNRLDMNRNNNINFIKYLVHLKTQQAYEFQETDKTTYNKIKKWFAQFEEVLKIIFENENLSLVFDKANYNFLIKENNKSYSFNQLSAGYSAVIDIVSELVLRMTGKDNHSFIFDKYGIVLIDEIETHLHITLQKKIFKVITKMFPNVQFIVTTHSPFILNSAENSVIYDLENNLRYDDLTYYSYDRIIETYFNHNKYNQQILDELKEYEDLAFKSRLNSVQEKRFLELYDKLKNITSEVAYEVNMKFKEIEIRRKMNQ